MDLLLWFIAPVQAFSLPRVAHCSLIFALLINMHKHLNGIMCLAKKKTKQKSNTTTWCPYEGKKLHRENQCRSGRFLITKINLLLRLSSWGCAEWGKGSLTWHLFSPDISFSLSFHTLLCFISESNLVLIFWGFVWVEVRSVFNREAGSGSESYNTHCEQWEIK